MAKRYDNDFDAEAFVENFRAQDDSAPPHGAYRKRFQKAVDNVNFKGIIQERRQE